MRGMLRWFILPLLTVLGGCTDTTYEGNMLLTDPVGLAAKLVVGVTREQDVRTLLEGSDTGREYYGTIGPDGRFVNCKVADILYSPECPFKERQYVTLRRAIGRFLMPDRTDSWRVLLTFDDSGVLRVVRQDYFEGSWRFFTIR